MSEERPSFLSRWSQRKVQARTQAPPEPPAPALPPGTVAQPVAPVATPARPAAPAPAIEAPPSPTLEDVARLTRDSDYSRFVAPSVEPGVRNAAMRKLFSDPHFNIMDGLDIYIGDYGKPDPIPPEMLRKMVQSQVLGLFEEEEKAAAEAAATAAAVEAPGPADGSAAVVDVAAAPEDPTPSGFVAAAPDGAAADNPAHDDDAHLQLQPDHAAGFGGADQGTRTDEV